MYYGVNKLKILRSEILLVIYDLEGLQYETIERNLYFLQFPEKLPYERIIIEKKWLRLEFMLIFPTVAAT